MKPKKALDELFNYAIIKAENDNNSGYIVNCYNTVFNSLLIWEKGSTPKEEGGYYLYGKDTNNEDVICIGFYYNSDWVITEGLTEIFGYAKISFPEFIKNKKEDK